MEGASTGFCVAAIAVRHGAIEALQAGMARHVLRANGHDGRSDYKAGCR